MQFKNRLAGILIVMGLLLAMSPPSPAQFSSNLTYYELNKPKRNLAPVMLDDIRTIRMDELMFDALYGFNDRGEPEPQMAQGMPTLLDDSTRALIILKSSLLWPDSTPITVDDVIFTFNLKNVIPKTKDSRRGLELIKEVKRGEAPNSVIFKFARVIQYPERLLANIFILPKNRIPDQGALDKYSEKPMGAGPFQLRNISISENSYNFIKNANYQTITPGRPYLDEVKMIYWTTKANWPVNIMNGIVDILPDMEYNTELSTKPQITKIPVKTNTTPMILFNCQDPILRNSYVRQGMQHLIPRNQICETIYNQDTAGVLTGPYPPSSYFFNPSVPPWEYDTNLAYSLFEKSGLLTFKDGKVIRRDTGKQWNLTLVTYMVGAGEEDNLRDALEAIVNYFLSAGIAADLKYRPSEGYVRALETGEFQLIYLKVTLDDNFNIEPFFSSAAITRPGGQNFGKYSNGEADRAFKEMLMTPVPYKQRSLGLALHHILHDDPPAIFLWDLFKYAYCRSELQNVKIDPFFFFSTVDKWSEKSD